MRKKILIFILLVAFSSSAFAQDIKGFWKVVNDKTGKVNCIVAVYEYQNRCYGRIIGTYDKQGAMKDTIYSPVERAPGIDGNPHYCGLDLIWDLNPKKGKYFGKILDPQKGDVYKAELWIEKGKLIVRGKLLFFGRNQEWMPATEKDFPAGFKIPDVATFIPKFPKEKKK